MAVALLQKLDDLTECSICCGTYKDPRQLPCLHSFCLTCLQEYALKKWMYNRLSCPLCRKETKLPCNGIPGFPKNFFMEKIMEIKRLSRPVAKDTMCDLCSVDEKDTFDLGLFDVPDAEMYCVNCHSNFCANCAKEHRRHMRSHCIVELGCDKVTEQLLKTFATSYCSTHPQDTVRMFCRDCNVVICFVCFAEEHQMHKCSDINKEAEIMRKQIEADIKGVSSCLSAYQQAVTEMDKKRNNFLKHIETVEKDICIRSNHLKELIDRDTKALLVELESIKSTELKDMRVKTEELDRSVTILNSFKTYGEEIVALGSASDVCHSFCQFHNRYDEMTGNFTVHPFHKFSPKTVTLKTTAVNDGQQNNLVGRIEDVLNENEDSDDGLNILLSINICEKIGRLKEMFIGSREIEEWQDFPFEFKQISEADKRLFVLSIFTLIDDFTIAEYMLPDMIGVDELAAVLTSSFTADKILMIVFERGKRVVKLIGSRAQVAETKRSVELMAGENLICYSLPEIYCKSTADKGDRRIVETEEDSYNEEEYPEEDDVWYSSTHSTHFYHGKLSKGVEMQRGRKKKSGVKLEEKSKKKDEKKCRKTERKKYNSDS